LKFAVGKQQLRRLQCLNKSAITVYKSLITTLMLWHTHTHTHTYRDIVAKQPFH